jgi:flagellar basal body P-ring formation protein FlgA
VIARVLTLLVLARAAPVLALGPQARIELLDQARVSAGTVVLGQVARIRTNDLALMRKLVALPVGHAPRMGESALLQREALARWVRRQAGVGADTLEWDGAAEGRVLRVMPRLQGEDIALAAAEAVQARLLASGQAADVRPRLIPRDLDVPPGTLRLEVRGLENGAWSRHLVLWVDVWTGDLFVRTVPVTLEVMAGEGAPALPSAPEGPLLRAAESPATADPERDPPAVARGDWATLRAAAGPIVLESRVEALQDGRPGQRIRVRPQGASGPMFARVIGRGRLELAP